MIQVKGVTKHYDKFKALDDISLHVRKGAIYGLVGANGAGKTTLLNHICGVLKGETGEILINGESAFENENVKQKVINIADDWYYYPTFTIKQMAGFYKDIYPSFSKERYEKIKEVFGIDEKKQIRKLSKGMKKQVAFWLALSSMPEVLVLDEPLDGLDPVMRKQVLGLVIQDVIDREMTVLVSSHNLRELEDVCDWVGIIHKGKMVAEKPLDDLKGNLHKYQLVVSEESEKELETMKNVLCVTKTGSVLNVIIRGDADETGKMLEALSPRLCERISLTLEEVFIYELGGLGYDCKNIII